MCFTSDALWHRLGMSSHYSLSTSSAAWETSNAVQIKWCLTSFRLGVVRFWMLLPAAMSKPIWWGSGSPSVPSDCSVVQFWMLWCWNVSGGGSACLRISNDNYRLVVGGNGDGGDTAGAFSITASLGINGRIAYAKCPKGETKLRASHSSASCLLGRPVIFSYFAPPRLFPRQIIVLLSMPKLLSSYSFSLSLEKHWNRTTLANEALIYNRKQRTSKLTWCFESDVSRLTLDKQSINEGKLASIFPTIPANIQFRPPWHVPKSCKRSSSKTVRVVIFGSSYRSGTIPRAGAAWFTSKKSWLRVDFWMRRESSQCRACSERWQELGPWDDSERHQPFHQKASDRMNLSNPVQGRDESRQMRVSWHRSQESSTCLHTRDTSEIAATSSNHFMKTPIFIFLANFTHSLHSPNGEANLEKNGSSHR